MPTGQAEQFGRQIKSMQTRQIGSIPLVTPLLQGLGVRETTNEVAVSQADVDLGRVVELLVLNRLMSPTPLYEVSEWLAGTVLPELMEVTPAQMYDNRIGRSLDQLYPHLGELWARLASVFSMSARASGKDHSPIPHDSSQRILWASRKIGTLSRVM